MSVCHGTLDSMLIRALAAAAVALAMLAPAAGAQASEPPRVLLLGDSVTHGFEGEHTWRYFASRQLGPAADFVGPRTGTWSADDEFGGAYADPNFDTDHAARFGLSMWETLYWNSASAPNVTDLMTHDPDILVLTLGVNDLTGVNQTPRETTEHARKIVDQARSVNHGVDVLLFPLPQVWFERVPPYNALLPDLAADLSTDDSRVTVAPLAHFENGIDTYDDSHPNTQGQEKIAASILTGLRDLGVVPREPTPAVVEAAEPVTAEPTVSTPTISVSVDPPAAPRWMRATKLRGRIKLRWANVAAERYEVRCGSAEKIVTKTVARLKSKAKKCRVRAVVADSESGWTSARPKRP